MFRSSQLLFSLKTIKCVCAMESGNVCVRSREWQCVCAVESGNVRAQWRVAMCVCAVDSGNVCVQWRVAMCARSGEWQWGPATLCKVRVYGSLNCVKIKKVK